MFQLLPNDPKIPDVSAKVLPLSVYEVLTSHDLQWKKRICHEGKPVAVREKLFKILTIAHKQCQHGGRDKTSAQVRRIYSWCVYERAGQYLPLKWSSRLHLYLRFI